MTKGKSPTELGTAPVTSLLLRYAVPAIVSMIVSSVYNIIDSIFIGHIPEDGARCITALAIAFPLMNLSAAFGSLVGAGGATLVSIKLGQNDNDAANTVLGNVTTLNVIIGLVLMIFGLVFMDEILVQFGATFDSSPGAGDGTIEPAREFMTIILIGNVLTHLFFGLNNLMRSSGNPQKAMFTTLMTVFSNLVLAPIFIFVFGLGIKGAALATVSAQTISLISILYHFSSQKYVLSFTMDKFRLDKRIVKGIFSIGIAPFTLNLCACIVTMMFNKTLLQYGGNDAIGAYGIVNRILMISAMIVLGFNQGMQPIAGYNFGAGQKDRVSQVLRTTIIMATVVMCINFTVCELIPQHLASLFLGSESGSGSENLMSLATKGLRIGCMMMPIVGFQMVVSNFFQSIGRAPISLFMSATRQLIYLVPLILVLPKFFGLDGVWYAMPVSDSLAAITALIVMKTQYRKALNNVAK